MPKYTLASLAALWLVLITGFVSQETTPSNPVASRHVTVQVVGR